MQTSDAHIGRLRDTILAGLARSGALDWIQRLAKPLPTFGTGAFARRPHRLPSKRSVGALFPQPRVTSRLVSATLWPDASEERANSCLRSTVWRLRRLGRPLLQVTPTHLRLGDMVTVDTVQLAAQVHQLVQRSAVVDQNELDGITLDGELLPGWYDDWVIVERERLRQLRLHGLEALAERYEQVGNLVAAIEVAQRAVALEPLRESAHRLLVRLHLDEGNVSEAVRQYDAYALQLQAELGLQPSTRMRRLLPALTRR